MSRFFKSVVMVGMVTVVSGCTVHDVDAPDLAGPSEFATRIALSLSPDSILQDGFSQTVLNIEATGANGSAVRGLTLRVDTSQGGTIFDFGTLSAKTVVTGDDGRARVTYTAPPRESSPPGEGRVVTFVVTPVGSDFRGETSRTVDLHLVPVGVILPPNGAPIARFTATPSQATVLATISFDASTTTDVDLSGNEIPCPGCSFQWDFGDGGTATGVFATHQYRNAGTYQVRVTATDTQGASSQAAQALTVGAGTAPQADFVFSPTDPAVSQTVFFNAAGSSAATGRTIVSYEWDFGNGRTSTGVTTSRAFNTPGTFNVTLKVTDDAGLTNSKTTTITVGGSSSQPVASLVVSPSSGNTSTNFFFDASASRGAAGTNITEYRFTFGDGSPDVVGTAPTTTHRYLTPGSYTARITVRDAGGRTATTTQNVSVQ
jgi:PKD repeat protein